MGAEFEYGDNVEEAIKWYDSSIKVLIDNKVDNPELLQRYESALETAIQVIGMIY